MFTKEFWLSALDRALKTAAQAFILLVGADQFNALQFDWPLAGGFMAGGFLLSIATSVAGGKFGAKNNDPQIL